MFEQRTIEDAHEIVPGIYLGNARVASNLLLLKHLGITHVLNAAVEHPNYFEDKEIKYKYLPLQDVPGQNISQYFEDGYNFIEDAMSKGGKVYVHCHAGISRSTTMLTSYLVKKYNSNPSNILSHIRNIRWIINPNPGFTQQLNDHFIPRSPSPNLSDISDISEILPPQRLPS